MPLVKDMVPEQNKVWKWCKWLLFLSALQSFGAWFFWQVPEVVGQLFTFALCAVVIFSCGKVSRRDYVWLFLYALAYLMKLFTQGIPNINGFLVLILHLFSIYVIFALPESYKHDLFLTFRKGLSSILLVSSLFWIIHLIGIETPHTIVQYGTLNEGGFQYEFSNYFFFLVPRTLASYFFPRFYSVFIEPGYLGCLLSLFLFLGKFKFSKGFFYNYVFLLSLFLTFSLAGWGLAFLAFLMRRLQSSNKKFVVLGLVFASFFSVKYVAQTVNDGNNLVNIMIFERLEFDETTGLAGNHRYSESLNDEFWNHFIYSDKLLFGGENAADYSSFYTGTNEVTAIAYIMKYGLISFIAMLLYFFYPTYSSKKRRFILFSLSLLFLLIFVQTIHFIHSLMYVSILVLGANELRIESETERMHLINKK